MRHTSLLLFIAFSLAMVSPVAAQPIDYASTCTENVDNATAVIPSTVDPSLPNGSFLAPGDTLAIEAPDGDCVGYGVWANDGESLVISAAGPTEISEAPSGLSPGDSLSWTVFDESEGSIVDLDRQVVYASCDTISVPTCRNDGAYADGAVFILEAFQHPVYTLTVTGEDGTDNNAGWRMLSIPAAGATRASMEDDLDFSVMPWSVVRRWQNSQWTAQTSSDTLSRGTGFIFYFYDSDENPIDANGLQLDVDHGPENTTVDEQVGSLAQSEEWHLLGNPFPVSFDLGALANGDLPAAGFQATVHVWDPDAEQYQLITQGTTGDDIAAWQGFFVQRSTLGEGQTSLTFGADGKNIGNTGPLIGSKTTQKMVSIGDTDMTSANSSHSTSTSQSARVRLRLEVTESDGNTVHRDRATYWTTSRADSRYDPYDAEELPPVSGDGYASVTLPLMKNGDVIHRALGSAPPPKTSTSLHRSIPLSVRGVGTEGTATLALSDRRAARVPEEWSVRLNDTQTDTTVDLRRQSYTFALKKGKTLSHPQDARFRLELEGNASTMRVSDMKATASNEGVTLRWEMSSEQNTTGFRVERSEETEEPEWTQVGVVTGKGPTDDPHRYRFNDTDLPYAADTLHYRLRAMTKSGTARSSEPIVVTRGGVDALKLLGTYPNPASEQATVRYAVPDNHQPDEKVRLTLYDMLGRRIRTVQVPEKSGRHEYQLSVSNLASGMYVLRLRSGESVKTRKVTVVQ